MNTPEDELHYFKPAEFDKPLCKQRRGHWVEQRADDHPRGRPDFKCVSTREPVQLTSRWNRVSRVSDNAMAMGPTGLFLVAVAAAVYLLYF